MHQRLENKNKSGKIRKLMMKSLERTQRIMLIQAKLVLLAKSSKGRLRLWKFNVIVVRNLPNMQEIVTSTKTIMKVIMKKLNL